MKSHKLYIVWILTLTQIFSLGSDFDVTFDHAQVKNQISIKVLEVLKAELDSIGICRVHPDTKVFAWRQKKPFIPGFIQRRLDFWLVNDSLQDEVYTTKNYSIQYQNRPFGN